MCAPDQGGEPRGAGLNPSFSWALKNSDDKKGWIRLLGSVLASDSQMPKLGLEEGWWPRPQGYGRTSQVTRP